MLLKINLRGQRRIIRLLEQIRKGYKPTEEERKILARVQELKLSQSKVNVLEKGAAYLTGLQKLVFNHPNIRKLPPCLGKLTQLRQLEIQARNLKTLPASIGNLCNLEKLVLLCSSLEWLPSEIGHLHQLNELVISSSQLMTLTGRLCELKNLEFLFIDCEELKALPYEIGSLKCLEALSINADHIAPLPDSIGGLRNLRLLSISCPNLRLPSELGALTSLVSLRLKCDDIEMPKDLSGLSELQELEMISSCQCLPEGIFTLPALGKLELKCSHLETLDGIENLKSLGQLSLSCLELRNLPDEVGKLTKLHLLEMETPMMEFLPTGLSQWTALEELNLVSSALRELPPQIGSLSGLRKLQVSSALLHKLPEEIGQLTRLESLSLQSSSLEGFPGSMKALKNLQTLMVSSDELKPPFRDLEALSGLIILELHGKQIDAMPESLENLTNLQVLDFSRTALRCLPDNLVRLSKLRNLKLNYTNLAALPDGLGFFEQLEELSIDYTKVQELPACLASLKKLTRLGLSGLKLHSIPRELLELKQPFILGSTSKTEGNGIFLKDTTLAAQPVSLFEQPPELIQEYYDAEQIPVNEAKVIFLGDGSVGKTYTILRMLNGCQQETEQNPYRTTETHGIIITPYHVNQDGKNFDIHFWDFGGQDIMHSMHRCFLTERTCYVVMVSTRTPDLTTGRARYWLRNIESFAHNAPVILAVNRWGVDSPHTGLDISRLRQEFPNLVQHVSYSAMSSPDKEFRELERAIVKQAQQLDSCNMSFPKQWDQIRQELLHQATSHTYYIGRSEYHSICDKCGLSKSGGIRSWLLEWFNDLGVCFSYHQDSGQDELQDYKILDPQWLTSAIYRIIFGQGKAHNGTISVEEIRRILGEKGSPELVERGIPCLNGVSYSKEECNYVLEIMRKFKVSYKVSEEREFIPALCNESTPSDLAPEDQQHWGSVKLRYHYLPDSVVHQLMIVIHSVLRLDKCWRKGLYVEWIKPKDGGKQAVSATVRMMGDNSEDTDLLLEFYCWKKRETLEVQFLLWVLLSLIQDINKTMNLQTELMVLAEKNGYAEWFSQRKIYRCKERGFTEMQGENENFEIAQLEKKFGSWVSSQFLPNYPGLSEQDTLLQVAQLSARVCHSRADYNQLLISMTQANFIRERFYQSRAVGSDDIDDIIFSHINDVQFQDIPEDWESFFKISSEYISPLHIQTILSQTAITTGQPSLLNYYKVDNPAASLRQEHTEGKGQKKF